MLPGKLCVGILEEDNPQKSYFRFKPLLIIDEDRLEELPEGDHYPEEGCIRIVPDKNESSRFKARMRRIGKYALLDLRAHPNENDKIRPNKNYTVDPQERNAHIVYSDVVVEPQPGMLFEILDRAAPKDSAHMALTMDLPGTQRVLFCSEDGVCEAIWRCEPMEGVEGAVSLSREAQAAPLERAREVRIRGFRDELLHFLLIPPGEAAGAPPAAEPSKRVEAPKPAEPPKSAEAPKAAELPRAPHSEEAPAETLAPAECPKATDCPQPSPRPPAPQSAEPFGRMSRLSPREQSVAAQTGLNPRRSRSLQEIIDDKWRRSRIDQLGHPVPASAMATPVESPVERAVSALKLAWRMEEARTPLVEAVSSLDDFGSLFRRSSLAGADEGCARQLNELEAQRLRLLNELSALDERREEVRARLLDEIKREHARELAEGEQKLGKVHAEIDEFRQRAMGAREAAAEAEGLFSEVERRLFARVLESRTVKFLRAHPGGEPRACPQLSDPTYGELISDVRTYFAASGMPLTHDQAVNLLACFALSPVTVLCGAPSAAKAEAAHLLAGALGLKACGRFHALPPAGTPDADDRLEALLQDAGSPAPAMLLLDQANAPQSEARAHAVLARLEAEFAGEGPLRAFAVAEDALNPLPASLVDRAFLLRVPPESADSPWAPRASAAREPERVASLEALARIFRPRPESISEEVAGRMAELRRALSEYGVLLSRRTLNATWAYCAVVTPMFCERTPLQALDVALAQRALPSILSRAPLEALRALPDMLKGLDMCRRLLELPMPLEL
ncbi:MAG: hypothetical protein GX647_10380 [Clostridiales bacterium]|nr:hypothetical protein [Clostridiales bacterium]